MRFYSFIGLAFIASASALAGCGDDSDGGGGSSSTTTTTSTGGEGGAGGGTDGAGGGAGGGDATTCTEQDSFCVEFLVPEGFQGEAASLSVTFYTALPAGGPPDKIGKLIQMPQLEVGTPFPVKITDVGLSGSYQMFAVLITPGGQFTPRVDLDYCAASEPINFTGAPINAGRFEFAIHTADDGHTDF
jgi:hypothetical protein